MIPDDSREQLQNIIKGARLQRPADRCSTIRDLLIESFGASTTVKREFESKSIIKERQVEFLKHYAHKSNLLLDFLPPGAAYLTRGGESKIYLTAGGLDVLKVNDAIYYATWAEYFNSLVLHNLLFPNTAYYIKIRVL